MNIEMIPFNKRNLIPEGKYLFRTKRTFPLKDGWIASEVKRSGNHMSVDIRNQEIIQISKTTIP